ILLAGFPCQPFSAAGIKRGFDDTRGTLFFNIKEILRIKRPNTFLLENVKGLTGHDKGKTFNIILRELEQIGYKVFYKVLSAKDFGLPQNRQRLFIIGFLDGGNEFQFPKPTYSKTQVGSILEKKVSDKYTLSDKLWAGHKRRKKEHARKGNGFGYSLFNKNSEYTNTISARYYKDGSEILIEQKNKNPRRLTPRECARLQGFPDNFAIPVSDTQAYKQFGNSVPVNVIKHIAYEIIKELNLLNQKRSRKTYQIQQETSLHL
ncbi:MAG: DNA (cytosine-5-)-methyltransferase, partial [Bdellovibrionales bacterium]